MIVIIVDTKYPQIEFDPDKNRINIDKHGVSLGLARELEWDTVYVEPDLRRDYGEFRYIGLGLVEQRAFCIAFTIRAQTYRIISLRKANQREVRKYANHLENGTTY